jgi:hypothetical protein
MSTIEDRLHSAIRETASEITPDSVPPLTLPGPARADRARWPGRSASRTSWRRVLTPLAAAAAVIAVIAASLILTSSDGSRSAPSHHHLGGGTVAAGLPAAVLASIPAYYVGLTGYPGEKHLKAVVRASATSAALATVRVPAGYSSFTRVSAAADDRTFVVSAQRHAAPVAGAHGAAARLPDSQQEVVFFALKFNPADHAARLTLLPVQPVRGSDGNGSKFGVGGISLSPDGSKLAMIVDRPSPLTPEITVADVATGAQRTWQWHGAGWLDDFRGTISPLSWTADSRTLAFQQGHGFTTTGARLLDTQAPGSNLRTASKLAAQWQFSQDRAMNVTITGDGSKIVASVTQVTKHPARSHLRITEFSARTGQVVRVAGDWVYADGAGGQQVLWSNRSGNTLIVLAPATSPTSGKVLTDPPWAVGVLSGGHITPLPHADAVNTDYSAW